MTDAAHMLSDFASFLISLFAIWVARRPPSSGMSFGWHRAGESLALHYSVTTPMTTPTVISGFCDKSIY